MSEKSLEIVKKAAQAIYDKKGSNIIALDVQGVCTATDYFIIAEGNVDRHVVAIAQEVEHSLKQNGELPLRVEGRQNGDWIILDYGNIMVHLFMPGLREKYGLEQLWSQGRPVELSFENALA